MRGLRLPFALVLIGPGFMAGCAGGFLGPEVSGTRSAATVVGRGEAATAEPANSSAAAEEKNDAAVASAESETATPPVTAHDPNATPGERIVEQLNDATRELATLRASNAKLKAAATKPTIVRGPDPADAALSASFRSYGQFKQELAGFFADFDKLRAENTALSAELKEAAAGSQEAKASLAKLESELQSEKEARAQAEETVAKLREQLRAVADAVAAAGLSFDKAPPAAEPTARLETSRARLRAATPVRQHVVKEGESLESIADRYYGDPTKWKLILEANRRRLPLDGTMPAGLALEIPAQ